MAKSFNPDVEFTTLYQLAVDNINEFFTLTRLEDPKAYQFLDHYLPRYIGLMNLKIKERAIDKKLIYKLDKLKSFDNLFRLYGKDSSINNLDKIMVMLKTTSNFTFILGEEQQIDYPGYY
jgi:hypothetical protein